MIDKIFIVVQADNHIIESVWTSYTLAESAIIYYKSHYSLTPPRYLIIERKLNITNNTRNREAVLQAEFGDRVHIKISEEGRLELTLANQTQEITSWFNNEQLEELIITLTQFKKEVK